MYDITPSLIKLWANLDRFLKECALKYDSTEKSLLEIGPSDVHQTAKDYFLKLKVKTMDICSKMNPDYIADLCKDNSSIISSNSFDYISCCEVLDHVTNPFAAISEMRRILKPDGLVFITTPFNLGIHTPFPDCWRYSKMGLENLFKDWKIEKISHVGDDNFPIQYTLIAKKL